MKQKLTLYSMILIVLETICLFIPYCFIRENWFYKSNSIVYHGEATLEYRDNVNIFDVSTGLGRTLAIVVVLIMIFSFFAFLLAFLQKKTILEKYYYYTPLVSLVFLITLSIHAKSHAKVEYETFFYEWDINWLFYIIIALHIITLLFCVILKFNRFEKLLTQFTNKKETNVNNDTVSNADELLKYKELLDTGVITQEEFDAKKKQLLGL